MSSSLLGKESVCFSLCLSLLLPLGPALSHLLARSLALLNEYIKSLTNKK